MHHLLDYRLIPIAVLGFGCFLSWRTRQRWVRGVTAFLAAALVSVAHASPYAVARNVIGERPAEPDSLFRNSSPEHAWFATGVHVTQQAITRVNHSFWPEHSMAVATLVFLALLPSRRVGERAGQLTGTESDAA
jgi:hypothetical protein